MTDESAIGRALAAYCMLCDDKRFDELGECFTEDATLLVRGESVEGRAAIARWYRETQGDPGRRGKHITSNVVSDIDGDRATVVSDFVFLRFDGGLLVPGTVGRYRDSMVREADGWRFARREIDILQPPE